MGITMMVQFLSREVTCSMFIPENSQAKVTHGLSLGRW
jgi:hypothetical protein